MTNAAARPRNLARLIERLLVGGTMTRSELGDSTGLSKATVARLVTELEDAGLIEAQLTTPSAATQETADGPGRKPTGFGIPRQLGHVIGFSLGLRSSHAIALDLAGREIASRLVPTEPFRSAEHAFEWSEKFIREFNASLIDGADDCTPGSGARTGAATNGAAGTTLQSGPLLRMCTALPGRVREGAPISLLPEPLNVLQGYSLRDELETRLNIPNMLETDADMALEGVAARGYIEPSASAVLFTMSTMLTVATRTQAGVIEARTAALGNFAALPIPVRAGILFEQDQHTATTRPAEAEPTAGALLSVRGIVEFAAVAGAQIEHTEELWTRQDPAMQRVRESFAAALDAVIRVAAITTDPEVCVLTGRLAPLAAAVLPQLQERLSRSLDEPPSIVVTGDDDNGLTTARGAAGHALALEQRALVSRVRAGE